MAWVKLDDGFTDHPKIAALSAGAFRLHVAGMCYSGRTLSDGFIPAGRERMLIDGFRRLLLKELVGAGLWDVEDGGHRLHDFLDYNPSAEHVKAERDWARVRKELYATPGLVDAIRQRDGNLCRYCGHTVNWKDRRGPLGATYDHVIPRGPNTLENVVVACRGCNASKRNRTPEQAGMPLLIPRSGTSTGPSSVPVTRPQPDPSRPEGSRDGSTGLPLAPMPSPAPTGGDDRLLKKEQVELNVTNIRAVRDALRKETA